MRLEALLPGLASVAAGGAGLAPPGLGLLVWYDFATVTGATGTPVPTIADRSGNGNHGINNGQPAPRVQAGFLGGRNVVSTVPVDAWYELGTAVAVGAGAWELMLLCNRSGGDHANDNTVCRTVGGFGDTGARLSLAVATASGLPNGRVDYPTTVAIAPISTASTAKDVWQIQGMERNTANVHRYFHGGADTSAGSDAARTLAGTFTMGAFIAASTGVAFEDGFRGLLAEFLLWNRSLAATERETVVRYLTYKWSL